MAAGHEP
ncbi:Protein of unknown function [Lactobacillus delbrueckii subsp. bulgaricus]|nr:Protein of unknown function [Lactobacillus delbrueckii subsp. bulgaricus]